MIHVDPAAPVPLWMQIDERLRGAIAVGELRSGDPVPSVRDLARDLRVNPATVARAYRQLCEEGFLAVRRGEGTFVSSRPPAATRSERTKTLREAADRYAATGRIVGASPDEAIREVEHAWNRVTPGGDR